MEVRGGFWRILHPPSSILGTAFARTTSGSRGVPTRREIRAGPRRRYFGTADELAASDPPSGVPSSPRRAGRAVRAAMGVSAKPVTTPAGAAAGSWLKNRFFTSEKSNGQNNAQSVDVVEDAIGGVAGAGVGGRAEVAFHRGEVGGEDQSPAWRRCRRVEVEAQIERAPEERVGQVESVAGFGQRAVERDGSSPGSSKPEPCS